MKDEVQRIKGFVPVLYKGKVWLMYEPEEDEEGDS